MFIRFDHFSHSGTTIFGEPVVPFGTGELSLLLGRLLRRAFRLQVNVADDRTGYKLGRRKVNQCQG